MNITHLKFIIKYIYITKEKGYIPEITVQMKGLHYLQRVPLCIQIDTKIMKS